MKLMSRRLLILEHRTAAPSGKDLDLSQLSSDDLASLYQFLDRWLAGEQLTEAEFVEERRIYAQLNLGSTVSAVDEATVARLVGDYKRMKEWGWFEEHAA